MENLNKFGIVFTLDGAEKTVVVNADKYAEDEELFALGEANGEVDGMERGYILELRGPSKKLYEMFCKRA